MREITTPQKLRGIAWSIWKQLPPCPEQAAADRAARALIALADEMEGVSC